MRRHRHENDIDDDFEFVEHSDLQLVTDVGQSLSQLNYPTRREPSGTM
jgi:hypothetical protein